MENKILATVADIEISEKDLKEIVLRYPEQQREYLLSEQGIQQLLDQQIQFELMNKLGLELGLEKTDDFKVNLEKIKKDLLIQMTVSKILDEVTVTDHEAEKYYDANLDQFKTKESVSAKHILVKEEAEALNIKDKIENKELSFEEAAEKNSQCPSKDKGGDLGAFGRGMMVPEFEEVAFSANIGDVVGPVKTQFGYHLIKVEDRLDSKSIKFAEVKNEVLDRLLKQAQQSKIISIVKEVESRYPVKKF